MSARPSGAYRDPVTSRRRRALIAGGLAVALALTVAVVQGDSEPRAAVSTNGPAHQDDGDRARLDPGEREPAAVDDPTVDDETELGAGEVPTPSTPARTGDPGPQGSPPSIAAEASPTGPTSMTPSTVPSAPEVPPVPGSPDLMGRVVYRGPHGLESMRPDGTDQREEVQCPNGGDLLGAFDVSPDGRWVVQQCSEFNPATGMGGPFGLFNLVLQRTDGSEHHVLVPGAWGTIAPAWSPDGRTIAVNQGHSVVLHDVTGGPARVLHVDFPADEPDAAQGVYHLSWSPDGRHLVLDNGFVLDVADGTLTPPRRDAGWLDFSDATWSPDGEWIYARAYRTSQFNDPPEELQRTNVATGEVQVLLEGLQWGPNGMLSSYHSRTDMEPLSFVADGTLRFRRGDAIWAMEPDGGNLRKVLDHLQGWQLTTTLTN